MRKGWMALLLLSIAAGTVHAAIPTVKKIALIALGKDAAHSTEIESGLKQNFAERGVRADSIRLLFAPTVPVPKMIDQLHAQGYDSIICVAPRKTIQFDESAKESAETDIRSCLTTYASGNYPSADPVEVSPGGTGSMSSPAIQGNLNAPIPTNPAAAPFQVSKGTLRLYDVASGRLNLQQSIVVKMPADLNTELQLRYITHTIWQVITQSGILP
jgi:hypothetical protein